MDGMYLTLIILICSPLLLMLLHMAVVRVIKIFNVDMSNQRSLILTELFLNFPLLVIIYFINKTPVSLIYGCIVYNSLGYSYFHFFNMSETARRIRILIEIKLKKAVSFEDITENYNCDLMISNRLKRLVELGQIKLRDNKYILCGGLLLAGAVLIFSMRKLLGFGINEKER